MLSNIQTIAVLFQDFRLFVSRLISAREYVQGMAYTNGTESFWGMSKRGYIGTFHHLSEKHLHRYVTEFAGRYNIRPKDTREQMRYCGRNRYIDIIAIH